MVAPIPTASVLIKERGADTQSRGCVKTKQGAPVAPQELAGLREGCSWCLQRAQLCQWFDFELWPPEE